MLAISTPGIVSTTFLEISFFIIIVLSYWERFNILINVFTSLSFLVSVVISILSLSILSATAQYVILSANKSWTNLLHIAGVISNRVGLKAISTPNDIVTPIILSIPWPLNKVITNDTSNNNANITKKFFT